MHKIIVNYRIFMLSDYLFLDIQSNFLAHNFLDEDIDYGVVVIGTTEGSGAAAAGLQRGDVIIKLEDTKIENAAYIKYELYKHAVGDTVEVTFLRDGKEQTAKITLTKNTEE